MTKDVPSFYDGDWLIVDCDGQFEDLHLYLNERWFTLKAEYLVQDISLTQDGSVCALMFDKNRDSDGENIEEWALGIPAMMGMNFKFDMTTGIYFARSDFLVSYSPNGPSSELMP